MTDGLKKRGKKALSHLATELSGILTDLSRDLPVLEKRGWDAFPYDNEEEVQAPPPKVVSSSAATSVPSPAKKAMVPGESRLERTLASAVPVGPEILSVPSLGELAGLIGSCQRCALGTTRNCLVFGQGNPNASVMFVGEGPGANEDETGLAFVGRAGQLLTRMLAAIGLDREDVYIANIVKCRPPGNREPKPEEVAACRPFLDRQMALIAPRVVVSLGRSSAQTLLGTQMPLGRLRGRFHTLGEARLLVTYHPSYLLRTPAKKAESWADLKMLLDELIRVGAAPALPEPWWES